MDTLREMRRLRRRVRVGASDPSLTPVSGLGAVTELVDRLGMITLLDAAIGPIKARDRGFTGGELLVGMATAQLAGEDFLVGLDRRRADAAGQVLAPVPGLSSTTAAGLARKFTDGQWHAVETGIGGIGDIHTAMLAALPPARAATLCRSPRRVSSCKEITYFLETVSETVTCEDANYHALVIPLRPLMLNETLSRRELSTTPWTQRELDRAVPYAGERECLE